MGAKEVVFDILAVDRASHVLEHVGDKAKTLGEHFGKLGQIGGGILKAGAMGAAVGITAVTGAVVEGVQAAMDYQTLQLKTAAVLKSTGDASHQSVAGIQARAAALESMSGVDEVTIINGQNLLATFTQIQDKVGKGNDIFTQATGAALDMSTALGQDMQSSVIQLGKALNDPLKGITALSRVGVSFTKGQKDQIAAMVKSGNVMGAQKIILKELNTEFGGAAKAAGAGLAGSMARLKDSFDDFMRSVGQKLLPYLQKFANWAADRAPAALDFLVASFQALATDIAPVIDAGKKLWSFLSGSLWPALGMGSTKAGDLAKIVGGTLAVAVGVLAAAFVVMNAPIIAVIAAVALVAAGFIWLWNHTKILQGVIATLASVWRNQLQPALQNAWSAIVSKVQPAMDQLRVAIEKHKPQLQQVANFVGQMMNAWIKFNGYMTGPLIKGLGKFIGWWFSNVINAITTAINAVSTLISLFSRVSTTTGGVFAAVKKAAAANSVAVGAPSTMYHFDRGGLVPGAAGAPLLSVVHGGEVVLTRDQVASARRPSGAGGGGNLTVNITVGAALSDKTAIAHAVVDAIMYARRNTGYVPPQGVFA